MKRILLILLCLGLLASCTPQPASDPSPAPDNPSTTPSLAQDEEPTWLSCRIVDGAEEGELLLAELDHPLNDHELNHHGGKSVYRLSLNGIRGKEEVQPDGTILAVDLENNGILIYLDGEPAEPSDLKDGMPVDLSFDGAIEESFPGQLGEVYELHAYSIGTPQCPGGSYYDLCGLYLQVLDDLWEKDPGLNSDITIAGLDLSQAPGGLLESEKAALAWRFGELHGVEVVTGTFDELKEQGYFTASAISTPAPEEGEDYSRLWYQWEDGCLFSITPNEDHEGELYSLPAVFFNAEKWRSPLGAYCFYDCSAGWPEFGTWSGYQILGGEMIS